MLSTTIISLAFSLFASWLINEIGNSSLVFLKDNQTIFNRRILFQVTLPTFLLLFSVISIVKGEFGLLISIVQLLSLIYICAILGNRSYHLSKQKKLKDFKNNIKVTIIDPWTKNYEVQLISYSLNFYYINKIVRGEVIISVGDCNPSSEAILVLKKELEKYRIVLHVRKSDYIKNNTGGSLTKHIVFS